MSRPKLIRIYVEKKFLLPLRIVFLLVAMPFLVDAFEALDSGIAYNGRMVRVRGEGWLYFLFLFRELIFALFFIWLATGGLKEKKETTEQNEAKDNE